jgi:uncharacterized membrane protein YhaH (DUF805 family)
MSEFANGASILVGRGDGIRGTVVESRPGHVRCALETGQTVWVPSEQVRAVDGPSIGTQSSAARTAAPFGLAPGQAGAVNPYQPPSAFEVAPPREGADWKWLMFSFEGRIPRSKYWLGTTVLMGVLVSVGLFTAFFAGVTSEVGAPDDPSPLAYVPFGLLVLFAIWASLALSIKRWHDRGKSGFWVLINLIPYIGGLWAFIENGCLAGDATWNNYGPPYGSSD